MNRVCEVLAAASSNAILTVPIVLVGWTVAERSLYVAFA